MVDGEAGDLRKRGYVVPPYGEIRIEGFRTSQADVATFRFSSVSDSYAGQKGKARNVGVIAVALFEEQAPEPEQQIIVGGGGYGGGYRAPSDGDYDDEAPTTRDRVSSADRAPAPKAAAAARRRKRGIAPAAEPSAPTSSRARAARRCGRRADFDADDGAAAADGAGAPPAPGPRHRVRRAALLGGVASPSSSARPAARSRSPSSATTTRAGLIALGIPVSPLPDEGELMTRETADPFPGDHRFSRPPR